MSLLEPYWHPIWYFFPMVERGDRLKRTWSELQKTLSAFGSKQVFGRPDQKLWDGEYEALTSYLQESWDDELSELGIKRPDPERMSLEELWQAAREINAATLAAELLEPSEDNPVETLLMTIAFKRALGQKGEGLIVFDLWELSRAFGLAQDDAMLIAALIKGLVKAQADEDKQRVATRLLERLPDGVGEVYLLDQAVPVEDSQRLDLKTAIKLLMSPCRLDR